MLPRRLIDWLAYTAFRCVVCVVQSLSARQIKVLAEWIAWFVVQVLPRKLTRYQIAADNIRQALGQTLTDQQVHDTIVAMWVHLFRVVGEMIQSPRKVRLANCAQLMRFRNRNQSVQTLCTGRPAIMLGGHFGSWEMGMTVFGHFGFPMGVVARDLDNPYLQEWFQRFRRHTGHVLISKRGGGDQMVEFLTRGGHLALLADQDAGRKGVFVDFFGRSASTFKSIALVAMQYRALICVGYVVRVPDQLSENGWSYFEMGCEEVIDPLEFDGPDAVAQITQRYTHALERAVRRAPEQYFWVHRRWKTEPRVRQRQRSAA